MPSTFKRNEHQVLSQEDSLLESAALVTAHGYKNMLVINKTRKSQQKRAITSKEKRNSRTRSTPDVKGVWGTPISMEKTTVEVK